jgi:hypothetical protein
LLVECEKTLDDVSTVQRFDNEEPRNSSLAAAGTCDDVELLRAFHIITPAVGVLRCWHISTRQVYTIYSKSQQKRVGKGDSRSLPLFLLIPVSVVTFPV